MKSVVTVMDAVNRNALSQEEQWIDVLDYVWNNQILPLLEEYFYSQQEKLKDLLAPFVTSIESSLEVVADAQSMQLPIGRAYGENLIDSLSRLAGNEKPAWTIH